MSAADMFALPQLDFVAGNQCNAGIRCSRNGQTLDLTDGWAMLSIVYHSDQGSEPLISKTCTIENYDGNKVADKNMKNIIRISLTPNETVDLHGAFIYQLTVKSKDGRVENLRGRMNIYKNIDPNIIKTKA